MATKNKFYVYFIPGGPKGITDEWKICEGIVRGVEGARFKGFKDEKEARGWLVKGASYELKTNRPLAPGIYFDAGTGRGNGVEISVTDAKGVNLLHKALPKKVINSFGKHLIGNKSATNNYGELLALSYALKIAKKEKIKNIFGDSRLIIDYWSKWRIKRNDLPEETVKLAKDVSKMSYEFEKSGGSVKRISGDHNPADLGFHR
jgi:ribonuclease H-related protein